MFYALSKFPNEISSRVNLFIACAPVTRMKGASSNLKHVSGELGYVQSSMVDMSVYKMFDTNTVNNYNSMSNSMVGRLFKTMSSVMEKAVRSTNPVYENQERNKAASCRFPNEASTKEFYHYGQLVKSGNFQEYDYGSTKNQQMYGSSTPPLIDLSKVGTNNPGVPVAMFVGAEDDLADPLDTKWAADQIGTPVIHYEVIPNFDHGSFCMGMDMSYMNTVVTLVGEHNK